MGHSNIISTFLPALQQFDFVVIFHGSTLRMIQTRRRDVCESSGSKAMLAIARDCHREQLRKLQQRASNGHVQVRTRDILTPAGGYVSPSTKIVLDNDASPCRSLLRHPGLSFAACEPPLRATSSWYPRIPICRPADATKTGRSYLSPAMQSTTLTPAAICKTHGASRKRPTTKRQNLAIRATLSPAIILADPACPSARPHHHLVMFLSATRNLAACRSCTYHHLRSEPNAGIRPRSSRDHRRIKPPAGCWGVGVWGTSTGTRKDNQ